MTKQLNKRNFFKNPLKIGTRGSPLASAQADETKRKLIEVSNMSEEEIEICVINTTGDKVQDRSLSEIGGKGLFTQEIEEGLLSDRIDIAVHSMKDMPTVLPNNLEISVFLKREDARDSFISNGYKNIENIVIENLNKENLTLSTAESCTGGLIGHRLTQVSGSSAVYVGGLISYSDKSKIDQLSVSPDNIKNFGAVSEEVAIEMAQNVKEKFNSSIGVSVTGIAGPHGGSEAKPVGLVYVGYCDKKISFVQKFNFSSNREANKIRTSQAVLKLILSNNN